MDEYRHAIERMEPRHYLAASYYERSLTGLATLLVEKGVVSREELERRANGGFPLAPASASRRVIAYACSTSRSPATSACRVTSGARWAWWWVSRPRIPFPTRVGVFQSYLERA